MERRAPGRVAAIDKCGIGIEKLADALGIVTLRSHMDRMIGPRFGRGNACPASTSLVEKLGDGVMTPVPGHLDETAVVIAVPLRIRACFEQDLHGLEMTFSYCEV